MQISYLRHKSRLYLLMDSDPRFDVLHGCIQEIHTQNLEISQKAALLRWLPSHADLKSPSQFCTYWEPVEQVCEHLSGQGAFPLAHEGVQSLSEDGGDPVHIQAARKPQLRTQTPGIRPQDIINWLNPSGFMVLDV